MRSRVILIALAFAVGGVASCSGDADVTSGPADPIEAAPDTAPETTLERVSADECEQDDLSGDDDSYVFTTAYTVVDGNLDELCFGEDDDVVIDAWNSLVLITPPGQLGDLGVFAGFESDGAPAEDTLAYVSALDTDGSQFQMSINTVLSAENPDELLLTLAHEFSHVFTQLSTQLDRTDEAIESCVTYFNGEGCFLPDSLIVSWIDEFWDPDMLAEVDPMEASDEEITARCLADDGFLGSYASSSPEEDFAESFSAMVFRLEPATDGQAARFAWLEEQPGLVEFRDRADAAGLTPLDNNFEVCGQ